MLRNDDGLSGRVANILAQLDELKTSQFTSQDSGMKFIYADPASDIIPINASYRVTIATNQFTPAHGRPVLALPSYSIDATGYVVERYDDFSVGYTSYIIYAQDGTTFLASVDVWPFYHLAESDPGTYAWQTIIFTYGAQTFDIPFTVELRATDTGAHILAMETLSL